MEQYTLKAIFLSMVYTAKKEGVELEQKYSVLEDYINETNDISLTDMIDNIENVYKLIKSDEHPGLVDECPRCFEKLNEDEELNAICRIDGETTLCSSCGTEQALKGEGGQSA